MRHKLRAFFAFAVLAGVVAAIGAPTASATTPLDAYKTATGHWERSFQWTIEKSVTPDSWTLRTGDSGTSTYTIVVTKDAGSDSVWVDGEVCVTNNGAVATENLKIAERVRAILPADEKIIIVDTIDVSANPVLDPGESHCYPYSFAITPVAGAIGYENRARVTITNDPRDPGNPLGPSVDAPFNIPSTPTLINDSINVDDTNGGSWPFSASGSVTYDRTFTCDEDAGEHVNTATIRETGQSDDAKVTVTCTPPPQGCSYTLGYWKTHSKYGPASKTDPTWALIGEDTAFFLSGQSWYQVLNASSSGGNAYYILAKQYIAASLNALSGAGSTPAVDAALAWATTFFQTYTPSSNLSKTVRGEAVAAADLLDQYNNGVIGPGHCSNS
jgi:hypothetical protein